MLISLINSICFFMTKPGTVKVELRPRSDKLDGLKNSKCTSRIVCCNIKTAFTNFSPIDELESVVFFVAAAGLPLH